MIACNRRMEVGVGVVRRLRVPWCLGFVAALALAGCVSAEQQIERASAIKIIDDPFRPYREYQSGEMIAGNQTGLGSKQLIGRVDKKTGAVTLLVEFYIVYRDSHRRLYEIARNNRGEQLPLSTIQRQGQCRYGNECPYSDYFTVVVPEAELRAAPAEGYLFKAFARNGPDLLVSIPRPLIANVLAKVDADRAGTAQPARPVAMMRKAG